MTKSKNKILSKGQYITLRRQGHDLLLVPTREGKREAKDFMNREVGSVRALTELLEDHLGNGWDFLDPAEIGAMTEAPMLAESDEIYRNNRGDVVLAGKIYYFDRYMLVNEIEEFAQGHSVRFSGFGQPLSSYAARPDANAEYFELREKEDRGEKVDWESFSRKYGQ